jgi:hypothetical protein
VGVPPAAEDLAVHGEVVGDDVEVPGRGEQVERFVDVASRSAWAAARSWGCWSRWVVVSSGVWCRVAFAEHAEHAAGGDGAVLGGVADEPEAGAGGGGHVHERVEVTVGQRGGFVDDEDRAGVEGEVVGVGVGEVPGDGLALDPGRRREGAGGFALHRGAEHPVAGGGPRVGAGGDGGGLAGTGAADRGLEAVAALAPRRSPGVAARR